MRRDSSARKCERREAVNGVARTQARTGAELGVDLELVVEEAPKSADSRTHATDGHRRAPVRGIDSS